jgi:hypothetical protein
VEEVEAEVAEEDPLVEEVEVEVAEAVPAAAVEVAAAVQVEVVAEEVVVEGVHHLHDNLHPSFAGKVIAQNAERMD